MSLFKPDEIRPQDTPQSNNVLPPASLLRADLCPSRLSVVDVRERELSIIFAACGIPVDDDGVAHLYRAILGTEAYSISKLRTALSGGTAFTLSFIDEHGVGQNEVCPTRRLHCEHTGGDRGFDLSVVPGEIDTLSVKIVWTQAYMSSSKEADEAWESVDEILKGLGQSILLDNLADLSLPRCEPRDEDLIEVQLAPFIRLSAESRYTDSESEDLELLDGCEGRGSSPGVTADVRSCPYSLSLEHVDLADVVTVLETLGLDDFAARAHKALLPAVFGALDGEPFNSESLYDLAASQEIAHVSVVRVLHIGDSEEVGIDDDRDDEEDGDEEHMQELGDGEEPEWNSDSPSSHDEIDEQLGELAYASTGDSPRIEPDDEERESWNREGWRVVVSGLKSPDLSLIVSIFTAEDSLHTRGQCEARVMTVTWNTTELNRSGSPQLLAIQIPKIVATVTGEQLPRVKERLGDLSSAWEEHNTSTEDAHVFGGINVLIRSYPRREPIGVSDAGT